MSPEATPCSASATPIHATDRAGFKALAAKLPAGIGVEWTGLSREERLSGDQAAFLLAFSLYVTLNTIALAIGTINHASGTRRRRRSHKKIPN